MHFGCVESKCISSSPTHNYDLKVGKFDAKISHKLP